MMKFLISILFFLLSSVFAYGQSSLSGKWQGVIIRAGQSIEQATLFYADFSIEHGKLTGHTREEIYDTETFSVKKISGDSEKNELSFKQIVVAKKSKNARVKWCRINASLSYNTSTGYLTGKYQSSDCKRNIGEIILYKADYDFSISDKPGTSHLWFDQFLKDQKLGLNAPVIRKQERDNFIFEPVYFDFDKSNIRADHHDFLERLIKVVQGHSDLRVKVTGHTDSDGTNGYNDVLSKKRAEAIINFFVDHGLSRDRLEFDFKGETQPADTNNTSEGKQNNRRVDFSFI